MKKILLLIILCLLSVNSCKNNSGIIEFNVNDIAVSSYDNLTKVSSKKKDVIISMLPKSLDNPVFLDAKEEAEKICNKLNIKFEWLAPMEPDAEKQQKIFKNCIKRRVDGIIISCIDPDMIKKEINNAVESGIKVATFDSDCSDSKRAFYCGTDNNKAGKLCGESLIKILKKNNINKGKRLKLLIMTADLKSDNLNKRLLGFKDIINKSDFEIKFIDTLYCNDDINRASVLLEQYIRENNDVDIFFSTGGWPLLAPADSMPNFKNWCNNGGISILVDTFYPMLISAQEGLADVLVGQDFKKMGSFSIENIYSLIYNNSIESDYINTGIEYGDINNFELLLLNKEPWEIK